MPPIMKMHFLASIVLVLLTVACEGRMPDIFFDCRDRRHPYSECFHVTRDGDPAYDIGAATPAPYNICSEKPGDVAMEAYCCAFKQVIGEGRPYKSVTDYLARSCTKAKRR
ncbi:hypothetical protein MJO28_005958 [Puccinia striiformis f. sp. tritici]|uniref:Uncharacterized protein n=2 Tax=Puccinia striiformis TaxID=27350 RepID=A0A2S4VRD5_9BASI|nr:hypothetical protein MJO28_005958 [Puccinia striiformis f. sp. tritici]KAI7957755.1 hypothetical protein MJO29_005972 [Puccinia striiformis f. sp. tritici]POW12105.1 hypothetical protein PSHT_08206 [Puccinia striiformis]